MSEGGGTRSDYITRSGAQVHNNIILFGLLTKIFYCMSSISTMYLVCRQYARSHAQVSCILSLTPSMSIMAKIISSAYRSMRK